MSKFVVFAIPAFDHNVTLGFLGSMLKTDRILTEKGWGIAYQLVGGDPYLAKVRNALASAALRQYPMMTDFFFLDADLEWDETAVLRLLEHPGDVVAGIYPKKNDIPEFPCELEAQDGKLVEKDGWYKARAVPTGFLRIKRHVFEEMVAEVGKYKDGTNGGQESWNFFEMGYCAEGEAENNGFGDWWGEDYAWARKLHIRGGEIWIWPDINFGHRGGKTWRNNFSASVKAFVEGKAIVEDRTKMDSAA